MYLFYFIPLICVIYFIKLTNCLFNFLKFIDLFN